VAFIIDGQIKLVDSPRALKLQYGQNQVQLEFVVNGQVQLEFFALEKLGENGRFLDILRDGSLQTIHSQEATLEDIFIEVTGRSLL
jgi:fluoroquinolone transport system ATP-binding protein